MGLFLLPGATATTTPLVLATSTPPATAQAAKAIVLSDYAVTLTAYNAVPEQTDDDPFTTASGAYSNPEIIAARSQDLARELPFGTVIELRGPSEQERSCGYNIVEPIIGYRVIADTMNARYTDRIDILFDTTANYAMADGRVKNAGIVLGICGGVTIRIVGFVNPNRLPKTQAALAALVSAKADAIALAVK